MELFVEAVVASRSRCYQFGSVMRADVPPSGSTALAVAVRAHGVTISQDPPSITFKYYVCPSVLRVKLFLTIHLAPGQEFSWCQKCCFSANLAARLGELSKKVAPCERFLSVEQATSAAPSAVLPSRAVGSCTS